MKQIALALSISLALPTVALAAGQSVDQTKPSTDSPRVKLDNVRGKVVVRGWNKSEVSIKGTLDEQTDRFIFDVTGDIVKIIVDTPPSQGRSYSNAQGSDLTIYLPTHASVTAEGFSTDFGFADVLGDLDIETVNGNILISGNRARLDLESVSGDVTINDHEGLVFAESVSGDINYDGLAQRLELESVQGDIFVNNRGELSEGEFNSVSGDIDTKTKTDKRPNLEYNAVSGDIAVTFQNALNAAIEIETMSGDIRNHLTEHQPDKKRWLGNSLVFSVGEGEGDITISTVSGNVDLR